jgi:hypothetical protein
VGGDDGVGCGLCEGGGRRVWSSASGYRRDDVDRHRCRARGRRASWMRSTGRARSSRRLGSMSEPCGWVGRREEGVVDALAGGGTGITERRGRSGRPRGAGYEPDRGVHSEKRGVVDDLDSSGGVWASCKVMRGEGGGECRGRGRLGWSVRWMPRKCVRSTSWRAGERRWG